ncbi:protein prenyltransferase alpha subunit repeat-containing protein [Nitzschia inconspicua]|uniref:Protein farnesyltransferase/geranylgeranyltransferase type-1 subunit alpha n=1 Tax=Nitzschia inconspicua TaxID=303405 RepID=A0A9K3L9W0_9STRA|nr:protein prenyltransferase alpha subunit repeat-containing protein [Nitzschia inconspicua]
MMAMAALNDAMIPIEDLSQVFSDMTPLPQNDGSDRVCVIQYPTAFALAYNYMRAIWQSKEMSQRALKLTATCAKLNPANYTVWHYRRQCLKDLGLASNEDAVRQDLALAAALGGPNPKNYQIWYHRRALLETHGVKELFCRLELDYIKDVLREDAKNYHAWSYRQWILEAVDDEELWKEEMDFASTLIDEDIRNNSAWNQRWFVVHRGKQDGKPLSMNEARLEADFAIDKGISVDPYNESSCRYLLSILKEQLLEGEHDLAKKLVEEHEAKVSNLRLAFEKTNQDPGKCVNLTATWIDLLEMMGDKESLQKAVSLAKGQATEHDRIRTKYWLFRAKQLQNGIDE